MRKNDMRLTVRADGDNEIGYGHLMRTLTVARAFCDASGCRARYLMRQDSDERPIARAGFAVERLRRGDAEELASFVSPGEGPLLIDTYRFDEADFQRLHAGGYCDAAFDDSRRLPFYAADAVIDYAPGARELPYAGLDTTRFCLGPEWFPLRSEFQGVRSVAESGRDVRRVLVTFGGSDPDDQTALVLRVLARAKETWCVTVLLGPGYRGRAAEVVAGDARFELLRDVVHVAPLFARADLAVSGAGGTCLELASLGVPSVLFALSDDQRRIAQHVGRAGAAVNLGECGDLDADELMTRLNELASSPERRQSMSAAGRGLVNGRGAERIAEVIGTAWAARFPRSVERMST